MKSLVIVMWVMLPAMKSLVIVMWMMLLLMTLRGMGTLHNNNDDDDGNDGLRRHIAKWIFVFVKKKFQFWRRAEMATKKRECDELASEWMCSDVPRCVGGVVTGKCECVGGVVTGKCEETLRHVGC